MGIFHTADDVELISMNPKSPVRSHGDLNVPAEAHRMLAGTYLDLGASSAFVLSVDTFLP